MPINGLGTYSLLDNTCVESVKTALKDGVRLIDTAYLFFICKWKHVICTLWNIDIDALRRGCVPSGAKNYQSSRRNQR